MEGRPPGIWRALAVSQTTQGLRSPLLRCKGARLPAGSGLGGGGLGEGASPPSPPPSPMSLGGCAGVRATFSPSHPARPGAGLARAVVTSPPSLQPLGAPRVAAATESPAREAARQWRRSLTGPEQPDSATSHPGRAREQFGVAGLTPKGADSWARAFWLPLWQRSSGGPHTGAERERPGGREDTEAAAGRPVSCRCLERTELSSTGAMRPLTRTEQGMPGR